MELVSIKNVLFGSDFPFANRGASLEENLEGFYSYGFTDEQLRAVERGNAELLLPNFAAKRPIGLDARILAIFQRQSTRNLTLPAACGLTAIRDGAWRCGFWVSIYLSSCNVSRRIWETISRACLLVIRLERRTQGVSRVLCRVEAFLIGLHILFPESLSRQCQQG